MLPEPFTRVGDKGCKITQLFYWRHLHKIFEVNSVEVTVYHVIGPAN